MTDSPREPFYWLNKDSRDFLRSGYLLPGVTPEQRVRQIAERAEEILRKPGFADKFYDYMSRGWYSLSSPVWSNFGMARGLPISCFSSFTPDSMHGIFDTASEVAMMSKHGGGTAVYLGALRPRGAPIQPTEANPEGENGQSEGAVHFAKLFDTTMSVSRQGGVRRGSTAVYLPIEHPDIMEFLDIRTDGNPIQELQFAVTVTDDWMQAMIDGDRDKRKTWAKVLQKRSDVGSPYITFIDNVNRGKPQVYHDNSMDVYASNLCVSPDTYILTDKGHVPIVEVAGQRVNVWNGREFSEVDVVKTGEDQKLVRVTTDSGYELDCTPYHKFYVQRGYRRGTGDNKLEIIEKHASELETGDRLIKFDSLPVIEGGVDLEYAYDNGFYTGDGTELSNGIQRVYLYGDKVALKDEFKSIDRWYQQESEGREYGHTTKLNRKYFVPLHGYTVASRVEWLSGYLDADGTVTNNEGSQSIQVASINKSFLKEVQLMLQTLGVNSKVKFAREAGVYELPANDGTGENKEYNCQEVHRLLINGAGLYQLHRLGLNTKRLNYEVHKPNREASHFVKVTGVSKVEGTSDTYCFTEPKRGLGTFNGLLTGQCNEVMLPSSEDESFVCCLSSMNLYHYEEWEGTDAVQVLTYFLDAVMTEFIEKAKDIPHFHRAVRFAERHRALGLGVLGYHSFLQSKSIPFDTFEATVWNARIFRYLEAETNKATESLARLLGEPELLKGYGRRNTTTMALAPTTSSSFILGQVSQSIEPLRSNYFIKDLAKSKTVYQNPELKRVLSEKYGRDEDAVWESILQAGGSVQHLAFMDDHDKAVFKTFAEISPMDIVQQAGQRQKWIDQGQSLNLMIHPDMPTKDVNQVYIEAWRQGVKGLYYQHSFNAAQEYTREMLECSACAA